MRLGMGERKIRKLNKDFGIMLWPPTFRTTNLGTAFGTINYIPIFDCKELHDEL